MHQSCWPAPIVVRQRLRKRRMKAEVGVLLRQSAEVFLIKELLLRPCAVPKGHRASGFLGIDQKRYVRVQRSHACTAAEVDHLFIGIFDEKIAERPHHLDVIASAKTVSVGRADAGVTILAARRSRDSILNLSWR